MKHASNLFAVDFDAIVIAIQEANAPLVKRCQDLIDAGSRFPNYLCNEDEIKRAHKFARLLDMQIKECSRARLNDTKPFKEVTKRIEAFFKKFEDGLKNLQGEVLDALSIAARRATVEKQRPSLTDSGMDPNAGAAERPTAQTIIVNTQTGQVSASALPLEKATEIVPTSWQIESISRAEIDLEALRPFLTENALLQAANKHLAAHGPHTLRGANYSLRARL